MTDGVKVREGLSNRKWRELLGRYIFGLQEQGECTVRESLFLDLGLIGATVVFLLFL